MAINVIRWRLRLLDTHGGMFCMGCLKDERRDHAGLCVEICRKRNSDEETKLENNFRIVFRQGTESNIISEGHTLP